MPTVYAKLWVNRSFNARLEGQRSEFESQMANTLNEWTNKVGVMEQELQVKTLEIQTLQQSMEIKDQCLNGIKTEFRYTKLSMYSLVFGVVKFWTAHFNHLNGLNFLMYTNLIQCSGQLKLLIVKYCYHSINFQFFGEDPSTGLIRCSVFEWSYVLLAQAIVLLYVAVS